MPATTLVIKLCVRLPSWARRGSRKERACRIQTPSPPRDPLPRTSHTAVSGAHCPNLAPPSGVFLTTGAGREAREPRARHRRRCRNLLPSPLARARHGDGQRGAAVTNLSLLVHTRGCGEATATIKCGGGDGAALRRDARKPPAVDGASLRSSWPCPPGPRVAGAWIPPPLPVGRTGGVYDSCVTRARVGLCAAAGHFRAADEENLIVARSTNLEVYAMRFPGGSYDAPYAAGVGGAGSAAPGNAHGTPEDKPARKAVLQCVGRYDLSGHVEAMALMKPPGKERDCLLLVFRDAKMSVVEYSPATDEITTVALFMFEESELKRGRVSWHMPPGEHARTHALPPSEGDREKAEDRLRVREDAGLQARVLQEREGGRRKRGMEGGGKMPRERLTQARTHKPANAVLRVDPRRRCIALLVYESKLIIIPIRYSAEGDLDDDLAPVCKSVIKKKEPLSRRGMSCYMYVPGCKSVLITVFHNIRRMKYSNPTRNSRARKPRRGSRAWVAPLQITHNLASCHRMSSIWMRLRTCTAPKAFGLCV